MATAEHDMVTRTVTEEGVVLYLTKQEAAALFVVSRYVGGDPNGMRGHIDSVHHALARLDDSVVSDWDTRLRTSSADSAYFQDEASTTNPQTKPLTTPTKAENAKLGSIWIEGDGSRYVKISPDYWVMLKEENARSTVLRWTDREMNSLANAEVR